MTSTGGSAGVRPESFWQAARTLYRPSARVLFRPDVHHDRDVVTQVYDWERERVSTLARGLAGTASAVLLSAVGAAFESSDAQLDGRVVALAVASAAAMLLWSAALFVGGRSFGGEYAFVMSEADQG